MMGVLFLATTVLAVGFVLWPLVRRVVPTHLPGGDPAEDASAELRLHQAALYDALRELAFAYEAGQYTPEAYQRLREHYEHQAAATLQALDQYRHATAVSTQALPPQEKTQRPRRWLWQLAVASALVLAGLGWGLWLGGATSGPPDVQAFLTAANAALERGDVSSALQQYRTVLEQDPENAKALTTLALLAQRAGQAEVGVHLIDRALRAQPGYLPAWQVKGRLHYAQGDYQEAIAAWETYLRLVPDSEPIRQSITPLMAQARQRLQSAQGADAPPTEAESATISGTIRLADQPAQPLPEGAALFIMARTGSGPPLAVKRIVNPQFPVPYTLGTEDVMLPGRSFTGQVNLSAQVQASGRVGPLRPGDLTGDHARNPVAVGAKGVDVVLTPQP